MAQQQTTRSSKLPRIDPTSRILYLAILFILTMGPLIGLAGAVINALFGAGIILSFGASALIALPFLLAGLGLGGWYMFTNYREQRMKEIKQELRLQYLQTQLSTLEKNFNHPSKENLNDLDAFLEKLENAKSLELFFQKYRRLSSALFSKDDFTILQKSLRFASKNFPQRSRFTTLQHFMMENKTRQTVGDAPSRRNAVATIKHWSHKFFSAITINAARHAQAATLIVFSLLSIKLSLIIIASILGLPISIPVLAIGFAGIFGIASVVGLISAFSTSVILKTNLLREKMLEDKHRLVLLLEKRNHSLDELTLVSRGMNGNQSFILPDDVDNNTIAVKPQNTKKPVIRKSFKAWGYFYATIIFFLTTGQAVGFGATIISALITVGVATTPLGAGVIIAAATSFLIGGILLGLWHSIGINRDLNRKVQTLLSKEHSVKQEMEAFRKDYKNEEKHQRLFAFLQEIKETQNLASLYLDYKNRNSNPLSEQDFTKLQLCLRGVHELKDGLQAWAQTCVLNPATPKPPHKNCLSVLCSSWVVNPIRAAQATGLLSFALMSMGLSFVLALGAIGVIVSAPVIIGGFVGILATAGTIGVLSAFVVTRLMKNIVGLREKTEKIGKEFEKVRAQHYFLEQFEIQANIMESSRPNPASSLGTNRVSYLPVLTHRLPNHHEKSSIPESHILEERSKIGASSLGSGN